ncbi:phosphoglycerate kinase [Candidatus Oscillochloris fontis]|uniref:phosphoglycerate kinase n=1 Tax=Candidatus Oscillochloris fontis TaxID=2496868 RepID=UPI00101CA6D6|nr:phosphoglycerate kinase [Candidatus Oscillochloris fontis]
MAKKTIRDVAWAGKRALVRVDFNVPQDEHGAITDDTRIRAALPTIRYLLEEGASVVLMSHLGRPKGKINPKYSMRPVVERLFELLPEATEVKKTEAITGPAAEAAAASLRPGQVLMLENTRFDPREEKNDPDMAAELARLGDIFINDAFGAAHRANASTEGVAHHLEGVAGFLLEKELAFIGGALENPERPFVTIIGGAKISDKIGVIENLLGKVNTLLIGGGMANTFLMAQGKSLGTSLVEPDSLDLARDLMAKAETAGTRLMLPVDAVLADAFSASANTQVVPVDAIPDGWQMLDIGPESAKLYAAEVVAAKTVIWNGPMGVFEMAPFAQGTFAVAQAMADASAHGAITIIGGGDSVAAIEQAGFADKMSHVSTGGGASLELLEGKVLPGVAALADRA